MQGPKTWEWYNTRAILGLSFLLSLFRYIAKVDGWTEQTADSRQRKATVKCSFNSTISAACTYTTTMDKGSATHSSTATQMFSGTADMKLTPVAITAGAAKLTGGTAAATSATATAGAGGTGSADWLVGGAAMVVAALAALAAF